MNGLSLFFFAKRVVQANFSSFFVSLFLCFFVSLCLCIFYELFLLSCPTDTSGCAGAIDFNQELCDPCEKAFMVGWQQTMDSTIKTLLLSCERDVTTLSKEVNTRIAAGLRRKGVQAERLHAMGQAAGRSAASIVRDSFIAIKALASSQQRDINRTLLPQIQNKMQGGYTAAMNTEKGTGRFNRIKSAVGGHTNKIMKTMFSDATNQLLSQIDALIRTLETKIQECTGNVSKGLLTIYGVCWEEGATAVQVDPETQAKVRKLRDSLLPVFSTFRQSLDQTMVSMGMERDEPDIDILGIEGADERLANAKKNGEVMDLCEESDDEDRVHPSAASAAVIGSKRVNPSSTGGSNKKMKLNGNDNKLHQDNKGIGGGDGSDVIELASTSEEEKEEKEEEEEEEEEEDYY